MDQGWRRVGARIDADRVRRGHLSLVGFARAAGVGKSTVDNLIHARKQSYDPATLARIELALGWHAGSIDRIRRGLEPVLDADPDLSAVIDAWPNLSPQMRRVMRIIATEGARPE